MTNGQAQGNGGQGAIVAVLVIIAILLAVGIMYLAGVFGPRERTVEIQLNNGPPAEAPEMPQPQD